LRFFIHTKKFSQTYSIHTMENVNPLYEDTEMTPEELQIDFWDNMGEVFGYDIIGSESHPLKKAFELYCEMKKELKKLAVHKCSWCLVGACECDCDNCHITGCFKCVGGGYGKEKDLNLCNECADAYHSDSEKEEEEKDE